MFTSTSSTTTSEFKDGQTQFANAINILNIGVGVLDGRHFFSANVLSSDKVKECLILFLFCRLESFSYSNFVYLEIGINLFRMTRTMRMAGAMRPTTRMTGKRRRRIFFAKTLKMVQVTYLPNLARLAQ